MANNNNKALIVISLVVVVFFVLLMVFALHTVKSFRSSSDNYKMDFDKGKIAVIEVNGVIKDSKKTIEKLLIAEDDIDIQAIIIRIDSPGGSVGPTQEIYHEILRIDKLKPVYASFASIAASGGYYIAAATRKIFSNAGTITGSIGVIMSFVDASKLQKFVKINMEVIKSGKFKDAGSGSRSLTNNEKLYFSDVLSGVHEQFKRDITSKRKDKLKKDINEIAQGQIFSGEMARDLGLVDEIASLWVAGRKIHKELKISGDFGLKFIKIKKNSSIWDLAKNVDQSLKDLDIGSIFNNFQMMYLYRPGLK